MHEAIILVFYGQRVGRYYGIKEFNMVGRNGDKTTTNNTITVPAETCTVLSPDLVRPWLTYLGAIAPLDRQQAVNRNKGREKRERRERERGQEKEDDRRRRWKERGRGGFGVA